MLEVESASAGGGGIFLVSLVPILILWFWCIELPVVPSRVSNSVGTIIDHNR